MESSLFASPVEYEDPVDQLDQASVVSTALAMLVCFAVPWLARLGGQSHLHIDWSYAIGIALALTGLFVATGPIAKISQHYDLESMWEDIERSADRRASVRSSTTRSRRL